MSECKVVEDGPADVLPVSVIDPNNMDRRKDKPPDRGYVDVLLEISEEALMDDLEPYEYHCYQGWEEAVWGWTRVAPLASIVVAEKSGHKSKNKDAEHGSLTTAKQHKLAEKNSYECLRSATRNSNLSSSKRIFTKSISSSAASETPEIPVIEDKSKTVCQVVSEDQTRDVGSPFQSYREVSKYNLAGYRSPKPRRNSQSTNNAMVPIKNFTFLPPIKLPKNHQQNISGNKHQVCETDTQCFLIIDKINQVRQTKGDLVNTELPKDAYNEAVSSKYRTCQRNLNYYSAVSVSVPNRYSVAVSSKPETLHPTGYSVSKALCSSTANRQFHLQPRYLYSS